MKRMLMRLAMVLIARQVAKRGGSRGLGSLVARAARRRF